MKKPDFERIASDLRAHAQGLQDNSRLGESKIMLAFAEMITVMGWSSSQQDTNNIQIANLTDEIKVLKHIADQNAESSRQNARSSSTIAKIALGVAGIGLLVSIITGFFTYRGLELTAEPTISLDAQDDGYGFIKFASSTISFTLKNTSLTKYSNVDIDVSLFQTYFDTETQRLVARPVARFWNEENKLFRSYGTWDNLSLQGQPFVLNSLQDKNFVLDLSLFIENETACPVELVNANIYHGKFKYFFRIDVTYSRDIDNEIYRIARYYSLDREEFSVDLREIPDGFNWIIDANNDGEAIYILPFKSQDFVSYLSDNPPPYSDLPIESFYYDPFSEKIFVNPSGLRTLQNCFAIDSETLKKMQDN